MERLFVRKFVCFCFVKLYGWWMGWVWYGGFCLFDGGVLLWNCGGDYWVDCLGCRWDVYVLFGMVKMNL